MAASDHYLRFRAMSTADLQAKQAALEAQDTIFVQQGMGTKNLTRDLRLLHEQLQAIAYVLRERGAVAIIPSQLNNNVGIADFSKL